MSGHRPQTSTTITLTNSTRGSALRRASMTADRKHSFTTTLTPGGGSTGVHAEDAASATFAMPMQQQQPSRPSSAFQPYPQSLPVAMLGNGQVKRKSRRPSEAAPVLCSHCGKNYKHQQCLAKHLWEHSPYWSSVPAGQALSKHQKVQLLETASILCKISGSPGILAHSPSPSPYGTSVGISGSSFGGHRGIILEEGAGYEQDDDAESPEASSEAVEDDDEEGDEEGIFGRMDEQ